MPFVAADLACPRTAIAVSGIITAPAAQAASTTVVISEVYGGGGNSGAPYQNDFIELGNRSASPVDLTGWKVQYFAATGGTGGTTTLTGTIPAGRTFLIQQAPGAGNGAPLPTPDATGTLSMGATNGRVDLLDPSGALVDRVGFGTANAFETKATAALSYSTSAARDAVFTDTDNNAVDFTVGAPTPTAAGAGGPVDPPAPTIVPIADIQGTGAATPLSGQIGRAHV